MLLNLAAQNRAESVSNAMKLFCLKQALDKPERLVLMALLLHVEQDGKIFWDDSFKDKMKATTRYSMQTIHCVLTRLRKKGLIKYDFLTQETLEFFNQKDFRVTI